MKISEIRLLSTEEIKTKLADTRNELMNLRFQLVTGQLTDTSRLKITRRQIALYETILRERELGTKRKVLNERTTSYDWGCNQQPYDEDRGG